MNSWGGGAIRTQAICEAALGQPGPAAERLSIVIDRMPVLPMQDVVKPRTLDTAAEVFLAAGSNERATLTLGTALAFPLPDGYGGVRESDLQALRNRLIDAIGETETERLIAEGASRGIDEALDLIPGWLLSR